MSWTTHDSTAPAYETPVEARFALREKAFWNDRGVYCGADYDPLADQDYGTILSLWDDPPSRRETVLEVGSGTGVFGHRLKAAFGARVIGLDLSFEMLRHAQIERLCADGTQLPLMDHSVDMVVGSGVLHHLPELSKTIDEFNRCLKPSGRCFFFEPNLWHPQRWLWMSDRLRCGRIYSPCERALSPPKLCGLLESKGFGTVIVRYLTPQWRHPGLASRLQYALSEITPRPFRRFTSPWFVIQAMRNAGPSR